jgi:glycosyltransferase involved in cell wall biosynthesis
MKVFLLANRPEQTTRLNLIQQSLEKLGFLVVIPKFTSHNWLTVSHEAKEQIRNEEPDIVHLFNVPDIIYSGLLKIRGRSFKKLIYDYRSPWGIEMQLHVGPVGRAVGEHYEKKLARGADTITTVNRPLAEKVQQYVKKDRKEITVIPNYPLRAFTERSESRRNLDPDSPVIFIGRISKQEGAGHLMKVSRDNPEIPFWVIGDGPFAWWYHRWMGKNVRFLGWQPHSRISEYISKAGLCLIPRLENALTPYSTDKSVWKLNEYLNLGKLVVASGISREEERKNLSIVHSSELSRVVRNSIGIDPQPLLPEDYRLWESNLPKIKSVYESVQRD